MYRAKIFLKDLANVKEFVVMTAKYDTLSVLIFLSRLCLKFRMTMHPKPLKKT